MRDERGREGDRTDRPSGLIDLLAQKIVGQSPALEQIAPYVQMYEARLNPPDRPAGIFLLLGPTGTGKTRTVEALAEILHGSARHLLKIDCAEYQSDHEVAKLIGAPPGYVGHRETKPLLTQERLHSVVSQRSDLALLLFDEIEKAAPAFTALLLGLLDRGVLRLGDNTTVNFEKSLVFLTSNLGAREMTRVVRPGIGFSGLERRSPASIAERMKSAGLVAVRKRFSPEFVNRIDVVLTYRPLDKDALGAILDHQIAELQQHVHNRLADRSFELDVTPGARDVLLARGTSDEYGARELRRMLHRLLTQPLAAMVAEGAVAPGSVVRADAAEDGESLILNQERGRPLVHSGGPPPAVLIIDENEHLRAWLASALSDAGMVAFTAPSAQVAYQLAGRHRPDVLIADYAAAEKMLVHFMKKASQHASWARPRVVIGVPSEVTQLELRAVKDSMYRAKARQVHLIEQPVAAAIGLGMPVSKPGGNMVVDIGGGTTDIAVISLNGLVHSKSLRVAGDAMNDAIIDYMRKSRDLLIGEQMAEQVKIEIGSAAPLDETLTMEVKGRHQIHGLPRTVVVRDAEIREALGPIVRLIVRAILEELERTPPEIAADIYANGLALTGGGSLLKGLDARLRVETKLPVNMAEDPMSSVVRGAGQILGDAALLKRLSIN